MMNKRRWIGFTLSGVLLLSFALAQNRLPDMPGYKQYREMPGKLRSAIKSGAVNVTWDEKGEAVYYDKDGKTLRLELASLQEMEGKRPANRDSERGPGRRFAGRGRQVATEISPDGKWRAFHRDRNLYLSEVNGANSVQITTDGDQKTRIKNGTASWVYGEELGQNTAIWWSPGSKKVAFYRFDEKEVQDYHLTTKASDIYNGIYSEPYNKAGTPNPVVDLFVYDLDTQTTKRVDVRDSKPFSDDVVGHYVYGVEWSPDGTELLFHRTNRRQNVMEFCAANPESGACRVIVREEWLPSWTENRPYKRFLQDNRRFLWISERTGFRNIYLYHLDGTLLKSLTNHTFEVQSIQKVDEERGLLFYTAWSGKNPHALQLHVVHLDGTNSRRLTDPAYHHTVNIAPDSSHFTDVYETHSKPKCTQLVRVSDGKVLKQLAQGDVSEFQKVGGTLPEMFTFTAADGKTTLYGLLHKPSRFNPKRKYPLLVSVYNGPESSMVSDTFNPVNGLTELGFLVVTLESRGGGRRGKVFKDAIYLKCGITEIDDIAAGVRHLLQRPYVDGNRTGIFGTSYGGYASVMCILRYPNLFRAASGSSSVTDWRFYDTIYTERYMWTPQENKTGYDAGAAMTYAQNLKGYLMLYYGTLDDNVHPANSMALIRALQHSRKSFEVQVGPDAGHSSLDTDRMLEFFIERLNVQK